MDLVEDEVGSVDDEVEVDWTEDWTKDWTMNWDRHFTYIEQQPSRLLVATAPRTNGTYERGTIRRHIRRRREQDRLELVARQQARRMMGSRGERIALQFECPGMWAMADDVRKGRGGVP